MDAVALATIISAPPGSCRGSTAAATAPDAAQAPPSSRPAAGPSGDATTRPARFIFNFRNAPVYDVLEYLAKATGYIVVIPGKVPDARVTIVSERPMTADEAVDVIRTELKSSAYRVVQRGRVLIVESSEE